MAKPPEGEPLHPQLPSLNSSIDAPRTVQNYVEVWSKFLLSHVYLGLRQNRVSAQRSESLVEGALGRAKEEWDKALSPSLRSALGRMRLPFPRQLQAETTAEDTTKVPRFTVDQTVAYLTLQDKPVAHTEEVTPLVLVDRGENDEVVGVELLAYNPSGVRRLAEQ